MFKISCYNDNLEITKMIFELLEGYISERKLILDEAYENAMSNKNVETAKWLSASVPRRASEASPF